jgi:protein-disulfide isomerase
MARRTDGDPMAQGRADAPVVMIEYSDFQCPFCRKFAQDTEQKLIKQYVDKGVLRIEWRNFPIFGKESENAARASWAAGRQGRFWQFHETAFSNGPEKKNTGAFTPAELAALAEKAGVKYLAKFRTDMASKAAQQALNADSQEGYQLGVSSTPAFLINGRPILGAQPIEQFETAINQARLNAKKQDSMKQDAGKQDAKK